MKIELPQTQTKQNFSVAVLCLATLVLLMFALMPEFAFANSFSSGTSAMKSDLIMIVAPFIGIGLIVLGVLCFFGKVNWAWFGAAIFGIVLIFGHEQLINTVRGWFGI